MYFLVDYENVMEAGLEGLDYLCEEDTVSIFYNGGSRIQRHTMEKILESKCKFEICKLKRVGKNGLDFYIASKIGLLRGEGNTDVLMIISKDKGFSAVKDYWMEYGDKNLHVSQAHTLIQGMTQYNTTKGRINKINLGKHKLTFEDALNLSNTQVAENLHSRLYKTQYNGKISEVQRILNKTLSKRGYYLESIKTFGKAGGTAIYNLTKDMVTDK